MWLSRAELRRLLRQRDELKEKVASLEAELREERERSRHREDDLVNKVLLAAGRHGVPVDPKKAAEKTAEPKPPAPLTALEEARLDALRKAAVEAGRNPKEADQLFYAQRNGQSFSVGLPGEPYILPS